MRPAVVERQLPSTASWHNLGQSISYIAESGPCLQQPLKPNAIPNQNPKEQFSDIFVIYLCHRGRQVPLSDALWRAADMKVQIGHPNPVGLGFRFGLIPKQSGAPTIPTVPNLSKPEDGQH